MANKHRVPFCLIRPGDLKTAQGFVMPSDLLLLNIAGGTGGSGAFLAPFAMLHGISVPISRGDPPALDE
jgi:hypothetical protein